MLSSTTIKIINDTIDLIVAVEGDAFIDKLMSADTAETAIAHIQQLSEITDKQLDEFVKYTESRIV